MAKPKARVYGYQTQRLKANPEEKRFSVAWHRQQAGKTLAYLLGNGRDPAHLEPRDNDVAATVIQWLGSPVGQAFLEELGYTKAKKTRAPVEDRVTKRRAKRVEKMKDRVYRIKKILGELDIDLLNVDNPHA